MSWNYRIVNEDGFLSLCEVYYNGDGVPHSWTEPIKFGGFREISELVESLEMALADAKKHPVLEVADISGHDPDLSSSRPFNEVCEIIDLGDGAHFYMPEKWEPEPLTREQCKEYVKRYDPELADRIFGK